MLAPITPVPIQPILVVPGVMLISLIVSTFSRRTVKRGLSHPCRLVEKEDLSGLPAIGRAINDLGQQYGLGHSLWCLQHLGNLGSQIDRIRAG